MPGQDREQAQRDRPPVRPVASRTQMDVALSETQMKTGVPSTRIRGQECDLKRPAAHLAPARRRRAAPKLTGRDSSHSADGVETGGLVNSDEVLPVPLQAGSTDPGPGRPHMREALVCRSDHVAAPASPWIRHRRHACGLSAVHTVPGNQRRLTSYFLMPCMYHSNQRGYLWHVNMQSRA